MKDRLEDFINNNRSQFDEIENPALDNLWEGIKPNPKAKPSKYWMVAMVFLFALVCMLWYSNRQNTKKIDYLEQYAMQSPNFKSEHQRLVKTIANKESEIERLQINQEDYEEIFQELKELEENQILLESDFERYGDHEILMKTLFKYYERKTKILEILLLENEKLSNTENNIHHEI